MCPAPTSTPMACASGPLSAIDADLLVVPWFQGEAADALPGLDAATGGELGRALTSKEFQVKPYELFFTAITDASWRTRRLALIGGGGGERGTELLRKLATAGGLAARQRHVSRAAFAVRGQGDAADLAQAVAEGLTLAEFYGGSYKTDDPPPAAVPAWTVAAVDASPSVKTIIDAAVRARTDPRRVQQPGARAGERAGQRADAARVRAARHRAGERGRRQDRDPRRDADREARDGAAARRRARQRRAAAGDGVPLRPAGRAADAGARPGRQRHHLRHRRHLDQAGREDGADEGRHGGRRRGRLRDARDRAAQGADARDRRRADRGEHAGREGDPAGRRAEERVGQDGRGDQHRRGRPADSRRRPLVRAAARRHAPGRRRHAHRRRGRRAGER